jgi:hypothetical protein
MASHTEKLLQSLAHHIKCNLGVKYPNEKNESFAEFLCVAAHH